MEDKYKLPSAEQVDTLNENILKVARAVSANNVISETSKWSDVQLIAHGGDALDYFSIGDQFVTTFKQGDTTYDMPMDVVHSGTWEISTGETPYGVALQSHYTLPFSTQFTHQRAFLACPNGLKAGTYHVTFDADLGTYVKKGATYEFTLTQDVEVNGRVAGFYRAPDVDPTNYAVTSYRSDGITQIETVSVTPGSAGTDLGKLKYGVRDGNLNSIQETAYGHNRWRDSAIRQYLNSDKLKGNWWSPTDAWDIAPDYLSTQDGFLCNMDPDLISRILPVKQITYNNIVQDDTTRIAPDITYDKVFLPSFKQMYCQGDSSDEGEVWEYYKRSIGTISPAENWKYAAKSIIKYAIENHSAPQYVFSRSARRDFTYFVWFVNSGGYVSNAYASYECRVAPAVVIG